MTVQIFIYKFLFTIGFFCRKKEKTHETFHTFNMKKHFEKKKLKMKAHSETHFENEHIFGKVKSNQSFFQGQGTLINTSPILSST